MTPEISVAVPVFGNARSLSELQARLTDTLTRLGLTHELLFIDDKSPDDSLLVLRRLASADRRVIPIPMDENVGQHRAILAGLARAQGHRIVIMDADLQDPPELIPDLLAALDGSVSAVFAGRRGRHQPFFRRVTSRVFKTLLHYLCGTPADAGVFVAIDRELRARVLGYNRVGPSILAMIGCAGLPMTSIPAQRDQRRHGDSAYAWHERVALSVRSLAWVVRHKCRTALFHG